MRLEAVALLLYVWPGQLPLHESSGLYRRLGRAADLWTEVGREYPGSSTDWSAPNPKDETRPRSQGREWDLNTEPKRAESVAFREGAWNT